jgi:hypothetical protein
MTAHKKSSFMVRSPARRDDSRTLQKERWRARVITSTDLARHTTATGVSALLGEYWHTVHWAQSNRCRLYTLLLHSVSRLPLIRQPGNNSSAQCDASIYHNIRRRDRESNKRLLDVREGLAQ